MTWALYFIVHGEPKGKGRVRATIRDGSVRMYTPLGTVRYEAEIASACIKAMANTGILWCEGPVKLGLDIRLSIPASWSKKRKDEAMLGSISASKKPDIDNVIKVICDGLNRVAWRDDAQVCCITAVKRYSAEPGVTVVITPWLE